MVLIIHKNKNIYIASKAQVTAVEEEHEEDSRGDVEPETYYTCNQIPLLPIHDGLTFDPFLKPGNVVILDPNKGDNANKPIE